MSQNILAQALFEAEIMDASVYDFTLLLEDRIDFIKTKYKGALNSVVDTIAQHIDPTKNKKYTEWLVDRHLKGEDVLDPKVKESLTYFDKAKSTAHDTNIKNHTIESLHDVAHIVKNSTNVDSEVKPLEEIYGEDGVKGYKIPNKATSVAIYGPGKKYSAKWCTSTPTTNNMFDQYKGGKYTMHFPNDAFLQIHHDSGQAKDPSNTEIDFHTDERYNPYLGHIRKFMEKTADLDEHDHSLPEKHFGISPERFDQMWQVHKRGGHSMDFMRNAERNKLSDEQFDHLYNGGWHDKLANNPYLRPDQIDSLIGKTNRYSLYQHPNLSEDNTDKLFTHALERGSSTKISEMKTLKSKHIDTLLYHAHASASPLHNRALDALKYMVDDGNHKFSDEHIKHLDSIDDGYVNRIAQHQKVPEEYRQRVLQKIGRGIRSFSDASGLHSFEDHNTIHPHEVNEMIDNAEVSSKPMRSLNKILSLKSIKPEHVDKIQSAILNNTDHYDLGSSNIIENNNLSNTFVDKFISGENSRAGQSTKISYDIAKSYMNRRDSSASVLYNAMKKTDTLHDFHPNILQSLGFYRKKDLPEDLLDKPGHSGHIANELTYHPKLKAEHLDKIIDGLHTEYNSGYDYPSQHVVRHLIDHPNSTTRHFHKLIDLFGMVDETRKNIKNHPKTPPSVKSRITELYSKE